MYLLYTCSLKIASPSLFTCLRRIKWKQRKFGTSLLSNYSKWSMIIVVRNNKYRWVMIAKKSGTFTFCIVMYWQRNWYIYLLYCYALAKNHWLKFWYICILYSFVFAKTLVHFYVFIENLVHLPSVPTAFLFIGQNSGTSVFCIPFYSPKLWYIFMYL